ncbi:hypothetical protein BV898_19939, partial [Hypsibius exemplaris]
PVKRSFERMHYGRKMISSDHFRPVEMTAQLRESVRDRS